ncbi:MAG: hypothetical protein LUH47_07230 [Clostridiales bacterium]|nr:hypothetical protein [Clostridiales bacterium]
MMISGKKIVITLAVSAFVVILYLLIGWKLPVYYKINSLNLPSGCETVSKTEIIYSDAYSLNHIEGEKIVKYDGGYEKAVEYIEENNSKEKLENIAVSQYVPELSEGLSAFGKEFIEMDLPEDKTKKYVRIAYYKPLK